MLCVTFMLFFIEGFGKRYVISPEHDLTVLTLSGSFAALRGMTIRKHGLPCCL